MPDYSVTVNFFDYYHGELRKDIDRRLNALRVILRAVEIGAYKDLATPQSKKFIKLQVSIPDDKNEEKELCDAFKDIIDAFADFLDRVMALVKIYSSPVVIPRQLNGEDEIRKFLLEYVEVVIHKVATKKIPNPEKIKYDLSIFSKDASLGYFSIRNSIGHHKRIADRDMKLLYRGFNLVAIKDDEELSILQPTELKKGEKLAFGYKEHERKIQKGELISISEAEIEGVVTTLELIIAPEIVKVASDSAASSTL